MFTRLHQSAIFFILAYLGGKILSFKGVCFVTLQASFICKKILRKKRSIKKDLLIAEGLVKKIAILGGSTTSEIKNILELFLLDNGIKPSFYESEYNKYYKDALV